MNESVSLFKDEVAPKPPETYYDIARKEYLVRDGSGDWLPLNESQYKRVLRGAGFSGKAEKGESLSAQDAVILDLQRERNVHYAGPLAGWKTGYHVIGQTRTLVTTSPQIIEPVPGDCSTVFGVIQRLLGDRNCEQVPYFLGWLKIAYESLRAGVIRPGQVIALCGGRNSGKSLLQNLITMILGGRMAKPYQVMMGGTPFNADLFGAEHLMVEDESPSTDMRSRRAFGSQIKGVTVNEWQRLHGKHKDALSLKPFWRMSVSINDEDENIMVLPPLDDSLEDKIMIFKAVRCPMPMPTGTLGERTAFWAKLVSELPALLDRLTRWEIPKSLQCQRFGVRHYHHPEVLRVLDAMAPEVRLLALIDSALFPSGNQQPPPSDRLPISAEAIENILTGSGSPCAYEARRLLSWNNACGTYLGRLAKKRPERVQQVRSSGQRMWRILPPEEETAIQNDAVTDYLSLSKERREIKEDINTQCGEFGVTASFASPSSDTAWDYPRSRKVNEENYDA